MRASLADNPILNRERRLFTRYWWAWLALIVVVWVPLSYLTRVIFDGSTVKMSLWQAALVQSLQLVVRPDLLIAFFLVYRATCHQRWKGMRDEIAVTLLTPLQLVVGKAFVPVVLLVVLNAFASFFAYYSILSDPTYLISIPNPFAKTIVIPPDDSTPLDYNWVDQETPSVVTFDDGSTASISLLQTQTTMQRQPPTLPLTQRSTFNFPAAIPVTLLAIIEDFFYAILVVTIALSEYLFHPQPWIATLRAIGKLFLAGLGIVACGWVWGVALLILPFESIQVFLRNPALDMLVGNGIWFLLVLPYEIFLIVFLFRRIRKRLTVWLAEEN